MSLITAQMRAAVGRELSRSTSFPVSESDIRRWVIATYYPELPPARFWDTAVAGKTRDGGITAPEEFNPFAWMKAAASPASPASPASNPGRSVDFTERHLGIPGPGLKNMLNGGVAVEYGVLMRPGDVIDSVLTLASYTEKSGRLGAMLFTVSEDHWTNQRGETVRRSRFTLIRY